MNAMNEFVKPTLVPAIICLVITALLSVSHEITQPIIQKMSAKQQSLPVRKFWQKQILLNS